MDGHEVNVNLHTDAADVAQKRERPAFLYDLEPQDEQDLLADVDNMVLNELAEVPEFIGWKSGAQLRSTLGALQFVAQEHRRRANMLDEVQDALRSRLHELAETDPLGQRGPAQSAKF